MPRTAAQSLVSGPAPSFISACPAPAFRRRFAAPALCVAAAFAVTALLAGAAAADITSARSKFRQGKYEDALSDLRHVQGKDRADASALQARIHMRLGNYGRAEQVARALSKKSPAGAVVLAEVLRATGRYTEARTVIEPIATGATSPLRARWLLGLVLRDLGHKKLATPIFKSMMDEWDNDTIDAKVASNAFYVAEAGRWTSEFDWANQGYRVALHTDPSLLEANIEWGHLFLTKYDAADAEQSFDEVLKSDPKHPGAHTGMARVKLEQSYDLKAAGHHLEQALSTNSKFVPALVVRAGLEIDQNRWDAAKATLAEALAINPLSFEAHSLLATVYWLRDDLKSYEAERKKVLAANPEYAEFFHIIARSAVREHRYRKAIGLEKEAVKIAPDYFEAMEAIGTGYLRLGNEKEGVAWLNKAWKGDEYNVRTLNTLQLFDEVIPKQYKFSKSKYFKFRYHNDERQMLDRHVTPLLEGAFEGMVKRYGFTPKLPVTIELFQSSEHYSVRTVGLPNLGALGVCFGQVITAMSPSVGNINWGMVLWHELAHVFAIQLSNSRVPRWYTEGLSEYETLIARPEWRRENDADVWQAMEEGKLPSVAELNHRFMTPSMHDVVVAYHLSSVTIEYIAQTYGFDKIVEGLRLFGTGLETPAVIKKITGLDVAEFDTKFRAYLSIRLSPYKGSFRLPSEGLDDLKQLEIDVAAAPKSAVALARLALGKFYDGDAAGSKAAAKRVLVLEPKNLYALYISAEVALRERRLDDAKKRYHELIAAGGDGFDIRGRLGMIAKREKKVAEAEKQLCAAKHLDPERSYPYMELAQMYESVGRTADSLRELESYVMIEQMQLAPLKKLIDGYSKAKNWAKVSTYGEMAVLINPFDADLHLQLGTAYSALAAGQTGNKAANIKKAIFSLNSALMARPELRRPALAHIALARAYATKGKKRLARKHVARALRYESANAEALALRKKLRK